MKESEARAFLTKYDRLIRKIAGRAARRVYSPTHDAEDFYVIGQDACLKAIETFSPEHGVAEPAWVARLVGQAIGRERVRARRCGFLCTGDVAPAMIPADENIPNQDPESDDADRLRWLRNHERSLTPDERMVLRAVFSGQSGVSIAQERAVSKQRIDQLKSSAIEKLRARARLTFRDD